SAQERVQIRGGAGLDLGDRRAAQGEVEQGQAEDLRGVATDAEVRGLDVAVIDAALVELLHRGEEVVAVPLEEVQRQAPVEATNHILQRVLASALQQQSRGGTEREGPFVERDHAAAADPAQHLRLVDQAL